MIESLANPSTHVKVSPFHTTLRSFELALHYLHFSRCVQEFAGVVDLRIQVPFGKALILDAKGVGPKCPNNRQKVKQWTGDD